MPRLALFALICATTLHAQQAPRPEDIGFSSTRTMLSDTVVSIAAEAQGKVYVACGVPDMHPACNLKPYDHPPMQSVFKLPLAVFVLRQVDKGKLKLDQPVRFLKSDRLPHTHSPLQDAHPEADIDLPLRDILRATVSESDNVGADILLRLIGGPTVIQAWIDKAGYTIQIHDDERGLAANPQAQYNNYASPESIVFLLRDLVEKPILSASSKAFLDDIMQHGSTGANRIKALLPKGTIVAHKTGTSGTENGITAATNDVALVTLPNGKRMALAIFVIDSPASLEVRESVIARIAKAIYDEAIDPDAIPHLHAN